MQGVHKEVLDGVVAVVDKDPPGLGVKRADPAQQSLAVGVAGHASDLGNLGLDLDLLAEQLDPFDPLQQGPAQGAHRLIAHKQDGALFAPEVVLEVVADTSHMPLAERITLGVGSVLMRRDSSLVTVTRSPGKTMGSTPASSSARVSASKQSSAVSRKMRVASMARGLSMYTGKVPCPVTRFFSLISRRK